MIKIALSFDDGRMDNYVMAKEILEPLQVPATFNITVGYIKKEDKIEKPSDHEPMTIEQLKELSSNTQFEIASHGYEHNNDINNLIRGAIELRKILGLSEIEKIGIVSPRSEFDTSKLSTIIDNFMNNNISYLRVGKRFEKNSFIRKVVRKINRKMNIPSLYSWVYNQSNIRKDDNFLIYTAGIIKDNKLKEVKKLIDDAIKNDKSYILTMHSILKANEKFYDDLFTWDYYDFYKLCKYLKKLENDKKIIICKTKDIINGK